jgi:hypothetical protein
MRLNEILLEANILNNPKFKTDIPLQKELVRFFLHDESLPFNIVTNLNKYTEEDILRMYSELLDKTLSDTSGGDLSKSGKFDMWLTRQYAKGMFDYEYLNGEGGDALGTYYQLSKRGLLFPQDQDFNRFQTLQDLQVAMRRPKYRRDLERIKDELTIQKHKKEKREIVLINDEKYYVVILLNYGACYTFNNAEGHKASFCTGSSSGVNWFNRYAPEGIIIAVIDKNNINDKDGKWQIHAATGQMVNADQDDRWDSRGNQTKFGKLFPGLMSEITRKLKEKQDEIAQSSTDIKQTGYNADNEIQELQNKFPLAFTEPAKEKDVQNQQLNI